MIRDDELPGPRALRTALSDACAAGTTGSETFAAGTGVASPLVRVDGNAGGKGTGLGAVLIVPEEIGGAAGGMLDEIGGAGGGVFAGTDDAGRSIPDELRGAGRFVAEEARGANGSVEEEPAAAGK